MKRLLAFMLGALLASGLVFAHRQQVEQWKVFELTFHKKVSGNPFDNDITGIFVNGTDTVRVRGFYDGDDTWRVRFMPSRPGVWSYSVQGTSPRLRRAGSFECVQASADNHGPVRVDSLTFSYADGAPYLSFGTTCYAWVHQPAALKEQTLATLAGSCFNKIRMCVFPKNYDWNHNEPEYYPFEGTTGRWDTSHLNPAYFRNLEQCVAALDSLGIEADIIVYHPYDRWGFSKLDKDTRDRYMDYLIARLGAYKNVWWSMANEFDFMDAYTDDDWNHHLDFFAANDPYGHLRGIHNGSRMFDHNHPAITHVSIQSADMGATPYLLEKYRKPVVFDECRYEGNINWVWGTLSAEDMVRNFWEGFLRGAAVGHGEVLLTDGTVPPDQSDEVLWWAKGGKLRGRSHDRIRFLREVLEAAPSARFSMPRGLTGWQSYPTLAVDQDWYLMYFGRDIRCQLMLELPADADYRVEYLDTWNMTADTLGHTVRGRCYIPMPERPYMAVRLTAVESD